MIGQVGVGAAEEGRRTLVTVVGDGPHGILDILSVQQQVLRRRMNLRVMDEDRLVEVLDLHKLVRLLLVAAAPAMHFKMAHAEEESPADSHTCSSI